MKTMTRFTFCLLLAAGAAAHAASKREPPPILIQATEAVAKAEAAGAQDYAPMELGFARERVAQAQTAFGKRDNKGTERLSQEALADADLAQAKTRAAKARASAESQATENQRLRRELFIEGEK